MRLRHERRHSTTIQLKCIARPVPTCRQPRITQKFMCESRELLDDIFLMDRYALKQKKNCMNLNQVDAECRERDSLVHVG